MGVDEDGSGRGPPPVVDSGPDAAAARPRSSSSSSSVVYCAPIELYGPFKDHPVLALLVVEGPEASIRPPLPTLALNNEDFL